MRTTRCLSLFFFNDTATTEIYTLSLHDALPIFQWNRLVEHGIGEPWPGRATFPAAAGREVGGADVDHGKAPRSGDEDGAEDRKSTRLNSSHPSISYAVFCLKKKKKKHNTHRSRK